jgi:hypothetical protein
MKTLTIKDLRDHLLSIPPDPVTDALPVNVVIEVNEATYDYEATGTALCMRYSNGSEVGVPQYFVVMRERGEIG